MYFIDKRADLPEAYGAWLDANAELLQAQYDSDIKGSEMWKEHTEKEDFPKGELRQALLEDQGFICCYCGYPILNDGMTCAIEHFKPKADYKSLVFEYSNLFASCRGGCKDIVHIVKHEDTLESIAGQYSLPNNYLVEINGDLDNLDGVRRIILKSLVNKKEQHCDICKGRKELSKVNFLDDTSFAAIYYSTDGEILSEDKV